MAEEVADQTAHPLDPKEEGGIDALPPDVGTSYQDLDFDSDEDHGLAGSGASSDGDEEDNEEEWLAQVNQEDLMSEEERKALFDDLKEIGSSLAGAMKRTMLT